MTDQTIHTQLAGIQQLLEAEPDLKDTLQSPQDAAQIVAVLADAAQRHGMALAPEVLAQTVAALRQIRQLVEADPALQQALAAAPSAEQAAQLIQRAAQRHGPQDGAAVRELADADIEPAVGGLMPGTTGLIDDPFILWDPRILPLAIETKPELFASRQPTQ